MLKQRVKKIEEMVIGSGSSRKKRIEAIYNYLLIGDLSFLDDLGEPGAEELYIAFKRAEEKAKDIGIENVKGLKATEEEAKRELEAWKRRIERDA